MTTETKKYRIDIETSSGRGMPLYVTDRADLHRQMDAVTVTDPFVGFWADDAAVMALGCHAVTPNGEAFMGGECECEDR